MDYLIHQRVAEGIECVAKGGMCMPFYMDNGTLQRLSVDVDLSTKLPADRVESAVRLTTRIPNVVRFKKHTPSSQTVLKNNLVRYDVFFRSHQNLEQKVKVEVLYGLDYGYGTRIIPAGTKIVEFEIPHQMKILARGALMADKLGALAIGTVGLEKSRVGDIAKQVFDIGVLLRGATSKDFVEFFDAFHNMVAAQKTITGKPEIVVDSIVDSIGTALDKMLVLRGVVNFTSRARNGYQDFNSEYISKVVSYGRIDHHADILSVMVLNRLLRQVLGGKDGRAATAEIHRILANATSVQDYQSVRELYDPPERRATGISEINLERMDARVSCLLCANAALATEQGF